MSFVLNTNISALNNLNQIRKNSASAASAMEKISSGQKINRGADDPGGIAISQSMRARLGGLNMAASNTQDTINMLRTAESGLNEVTAMMGRIRDLTVRGANEATLTSEDRDRMQDEIDSLVKAISQVASMTTFNSKSTSSGSNGYPAGLSAITVVDWAGPLPAGSGDADYEAMKAYVLSVIEPAMHKVWGMTGAAPGPSTTLKVTFTNIDGPSNILATGGTTGVPGEMMINIDVSDFLDPDGAGPLTARVGLDPSNSFTIEMIIAHEMTHAVLAIKGAGGDAWGQEMLASYVSGEGDLRIAGNEAAVTAAIAGALTSAPASSAEYAETYLAAAFISKTHGTDKLSDIIKSASTGANWDTAVMNVLGNVYTDFTAFEAAADAWSNNYVNGGLANSVRREGLGWTLPHPLRPPHNSYSAHIGPESGNTFRIITPWIAAGSADYASFANVTSTARAQASIESLDRAQEYLSLGASEIGVQHRLLLHIANDIQAQYINLAAARSRIQDADLATEIAGMTKAQILSQSTISAAAQANAAPRIVLDLLK